MFIDKRGVRARAKYEISHGAMVVYLGCVKHIICNTIRFAWLFFHHCTNGCSVIIADATQSIFIRDDRKPDGSSNPIVFNGMVCLGVCFAHAVTCSMDDERV